MKNYYNYLYIVFFVLLCGEQIFSRDYLQESKIRVLDYKFQKEKDINKLGILFRSNCPLDFSGNFNYDNLFNKLSTTAARERQLLLTKPNSKIIIYNLIGDDEDVLIKEREYFEKNLSKGEVRHWPIRGEINNPDSFSSAMIQTKSKTLDWMRDDLEGVVDEIYRTLNEPTTPNVNNIIIVIHCRRGKDRTGEVSGAYQLKYGKKSWEVMSALNYEIYNENIVFWQERSLVWFCYNLKYHQQYSYLTCSHDNLSPNSKAIPLMIGWNESLYYQFSDISYLTFIFTLFISLLLNFILYYLFIGRRLFPQYLSFLRSYLNNYKNNKL